jgi:D-alanyl-lipoteichoic acid acyltransferase DltB (MBOAT superfamily)
MRSFALFIIVILVAIACAGIGVYYLIPGIYHILILSVSGNPYTYHLKHALLFFGLAVLALLAVRYVMPLPVEKTKTRPLAESTSKPGKHPSEPANQ